MKMAVIGCGHGGQALAAQMAIKGADVMLYADPEHAGGLNTIAKTKTITLKGKIEDTAKGINTTMNIREAVAGRAIVFLVLPTNAHESMFKKMLPYLSDGQVIVSLAANFTALYLMKSLVHHQSKKIILADVSSLPYACRAEKPGTVNIIEIKNKMGIACIPRKHNVEVASLLNRYFPTPLEVYQNCIELGINITSGLSHPSIALFNAGRIGPDEREFYFYKHGISPEIARFIEQLDKDRQIIGQHYGVKTPSYLELMAEFYGIQYPTVMDFFLNSRVHNALPLCPNSLQQRYISQDIPYVIVPWYTLGLLAGYDSKVMRNLIEMASVLNQKDYLSSGRNFISGLYPFANKEHVIHFANTGHFLQQQKRAS